MVSNELEPNDAKRVTFGSEGGKGLQRPRPTRQLPMKISKHRYTRWFAVLVISLGIILMFLPGLFSGKVQAANPTPTPISCGFGDIVCELQQAGNQLINSYVTPLKDWFQLQEGLALYTPVYNFIHSIATGLWSILSALVSVGVGVGSMIHWISQSLFAPLLDSANTVLIPVINAVFGLALFLIGIFYTLAALIRQSPIRLKNVVLWYVAALIFFQAGVPFYLWLDTFRQNISTIFYAATLNCVTQLGGCSTSNTSPAPMPFTQIAGQDRSKGSIVNGMSAPCTNFPIELPGDETLNGLDATLAYLKADGYDVLHDGAICLLPGDVTDLPRSWYHPNGYFDATIDPNTWDISGQPNWTPTQAVQRMQDSVNQAFGGVTRLFNSIPLAVLGIIEQLIGLCLSIAEGLAFISFACALVFAFFRESVALAIVNQIFGLLFQTIIVALVQAFVVGIFIAAAATGSPLVTLLAAVAGLLFSMILLWSGLKAIWNSFNGLFNAFGQVTSGAITAPGAALGTLAATTTGSIGLMGAVTGGAGALLSGGTLAQSAGIALSRVPGMSQTAFQLSRLPGLQDSPLQEAAQQFSEGAMASQIGGKTFGGFIAPKLLSDRSSAVEVDYGTDENSGHLLSSGAETVIKATTRPLFRARPKRKYLPEPEDDEDLEDRPEPMLPTPEITPNPSRIWEPTTSRQANPEAANTTESLTSAIPAFERGALPANNETANGNGFNRQMVDDLESDADTNEERTLDAISGVRSGEDGLSAAGTQLLVAANQITNAAGQLEIRGAFGTASVLGQTVEALRGGETPNNLIIGQAMANAAGLTMTPDVPPVTQNLAQFGSFVEQALRTGITGEQAGHVIDIVQGNVAAPIPPTFFGDLHDQVASSQGWSRSQAKDEINELYIRATMLPTTIQFDKPPDQAAVTNFPQAIAGAE